MDETKEESLALALRLSSGQQMRMSLRRRSVDLTDAQFYENSHEGRREIEITARDCYFNGPMEGEEETGNGYLALCDGELVR